MFNLYLLRHGETEHSRQDRFSGRLDVPLTAEGHRMARAFARAYARIPWRAIYTSTHRRAIDTAAPLSHLTGVPAVEDPRLDEIDYGGWQGWRKDDLAAAADNAEVYRRWCEDPSAGPPGGERPADVAARVRAAIADIVTAHAAVDSAGSAAARDVLVVSHKAALRILLCDLLGIELRRYRTAIAQPIAGLTIVEMRPDGPMLRLLGDTGHVAAPGPAPAAAAALEIVASAA